jgi:Zn-dependent protease with chaperone function
MRWLILSLTALLGACSVTVTTYQTGAEDAEGVAANTVDFDEVVRAVRPIAVQECRKRARAGTNCDFRVVLDPNRRAAPNAYQSLDDDGRPVLTFTATLIPAMRNADELAFIISHEAAHHVSGHLVRQEENSEKGASVFAGLATLTGGNANDVAKAEKLGAAVGARNYSKEFELEADELGTIITFRAGFNPLIGAQFFTRIPDPGDEFLSTHPPNTARLDMVRRTSARLGVPG